jgi:predicted phosphoribosyltransferase
MFGALGYYYRDFRQIEDKEVIEILERFKAT